MLANDRHTYGVVAVAFHWVSALVALGLFTSGLWMRTLGYGNPWYHTAPEYHKAFGLIFAGLILGRLAWKGINQHPAGIGKPWEVVAAHVVHILLYGLLITLFLTGYLIATGSGQPVNVLDIFKVPPLWKLGSNVALVGIIHLWSAYALAGITVLHALAAFKHHFINSDRVLLRMLGR